MSQGTPAQGDEPYVYIYIYIYICGEGNGDPYSTVEQRTDTQSERTGDTKRQSLLMRGQGHVHKRPLQTYRNVYIYIYIAPGLADAAPFARLIGAMRRSRHGLGPGHGQLHLIGEQ